MQTQEQLIKQLKNTIPNRPTPDDSLMFYGGFNLIRSQIEYLPYGLTINHGNIYLQHSKILELPENLTVNGDLYIQGTKITNLPDSLIVNGRIYHGTGFLNSNKRYFISPRIGSRLGQTIYDTYTNMITCGCFYGNIQEFADKINKTYQPDNIYHKEYTEFINQIIYLN